MMTTDAESTAGPDLDRLAEELVARGLGEQGDFYITGRVPGGIPSSEHIGMRQLPDGTFKVWYRDMGSKRVLLETADFHAARTTFIEEAVALARSRGRRVKEA